MTLSQVPFPHDPGPRGRGRVCHPARDVTPSAPTDPPEPPVLTNALSRSQIDTGILIDRIESAGARLELVTEDFERSATGTFLRNGKAFVAELEREKIRERTSRGKAARTAGGKYPAVGRPPYGYR